MRLLQDLFALSDEFGEVGKPEQAVRVLEQVLPFHPTNEMVLNKLAIAYNRAATPMKSVPILQELLRNNPMHLPALITLSHSQQAMGNGSEALALAEKAIEISPTTVQAHLAKANACLGLRREREAAEALRQAIRIDPGNAALHAELADVCWRYPTLSDEALKAYQTALELEPELHDAQARVAEILIVKGAQAGAQAAVDHLAASEPQHPALPGLKRRLAKLAAPALIP